MQENVKERVEKEKVATVGVWRGLLRRLIREGLWGGAAYLLGCAVLPFGARPFGIGLLCAAEGHTLSMLVGLILSVFTDLQTSVVYICSYAAAALIRFAAGLLLEHPESRVELPESIRKKLYGDAQATNAEAEEIGVPKNTEKDNGRMKLLHHLKHLFTENLLLRICIATVAIFVISLWRIVAGGFRFYDLFGAVTSLLTTPLLVTVWSVCFGKKAHPTALRRISEATLGIALVWAAGDFLVGGFPLAVVLATAFTLYTCASRGAVLGSVLGVLFGIAYLPLYAPSFLLMALIFHLMREQKKTLSASVALAILAASAWALYAGGVLTAVGFLSAGLLGGAAFSLLIRLCGGTDLQATEKETPTASVDQTRHRDSNERFRGISDAFASLSEMFYNLSDRFRRPGTLDLRQICDGAFDNHCQDCPNKTVCWGLEYQETLGVVNALISRLHTRGRVERGQIPEHLSRRCDSMDLILDRINRDCARLTGEMLKNNRTEIFAMDYESAAKIINDALEEDDGEYRYDGEQEKQVFEYLRDAGITAGSVTVYGNRRRQILIRNVNVEHAKVTPETLRSDLGEMCGMELSRPTFEVENRVTTMTLQAKKKIAVQGAKNNLCADGEVSGDTINLFSNKKDYFYALISDGMGSGKEAAFTSNLCSVFLEKMLRAGNRAGTSLRMLNNLICSREDGSARECSSTVDLMELDLMTAEASFIKSGAAPSFIVRGKAVHRLQVGSAPIGIIRTVQTQATPFLLKEGDTVVMISDGIQQNDPECEWLTEYLTGASDLSPEEIVYRICLHAANTDTRDDCSAVAIRILPAEQGEL